MRIQALMARPVALVGTDLRLVHLHILTHRVARDIQLKADSPQRQPAALVIQPFDFMNHYPLLQ